MSSQPPAQMSVPHQVSPPYSSTAPPPSFPTSAHPGSSIIDSHLEGSPTAESHVCHRTGEELTNRSCRCQMTSIDMLPDEVLLAIFDFCPHEDTFTSSRQIEVWHSLVHVCRRWRSVVFGSPRRLNLRLCCTTRTPVRDMLDIWPPLPLLISDVDAHYYASVDNIIAALEQTDRVSHILFGHAESWRSEYIFPAMQGQFPGLTELVLYRYRETIPDSFLGGSAPRLRSIHLRSIKFPGLPKLLSSATQLVKICLTNIPYSGYVSPEAMVIVLSTMTSLVSLLLEFQSPRSRPDWESRHPPPRTRFVLPVLASFGFQGVCEYLEDFVAGIDAPLLSSLDIAFFDQIVFDASQFIQFTNRTPKLKTFDEARVAFEDGAPWVTGVTVTLSSQAHGYGHLKVEVLCSGLDRQVSTVKQICTSSFPPFFTLKDLYILTQQPQPQPHWQVNIENMAWLELLQLFTSVNNLYVSVELAPRIVLSLQELIGGRTTEVLPTLQNISLEGFQPSGPVQEGIGQFVTARQVAGHPISVTRWDRLGDTMDGWEIDSSVS